MIYPPVIGIAGYARSGKDTAAQALVSEGYTRVAFADSLKEMALAIDPIIAAADSFHPLRLSEYVRVAGWEGAKSEPEVRRFLQRLGTEGGRDILGENIWRDTLAKRVEEMPLKKHEKRRVVIPDCRFPNEAEFVKGWHGIGPGIRGVGEGLLIWIVRVIDGEEVGPLNGHASESDELRRMADFIVVNDGTIEQFQKTVLDAVRLWVEGKIARRP